MAEIKLSPEIQSRVLKGESLMVAEYRQTQIETVKMRDKVTGASRSSTVLRHGLETHKEQVSLSEWLPDGSDPKNIKLPASKGQMVVVVLTSMTRERGLLTIGGTMELL